MNLLYYGDNLDILRSRIPSQSVDLVYLDPPFNSARISNLLFKRKRFDTPEGWVPLRQQGLGKPTAQTLPLAFDA